ncbi:hypothetical protein B0H14DRAFT_1189093 [Mycena olivaceomarginata]|nr:hypothetical protein B0H14DRAFT_1189093 [Mycena olivaceomarginata]
MRTSGIGCRGDGGKGFIRIPSFVYIYMDISCAGQRPSSYSGPRPPASSNLCPSLLRPATSAAFHTQLFLAASLFSFLPLYSTCNRHGSERTTAPGARTPSCAGSLYARTGWAGLPVAIPSTPTPLSRYATIIMGAQTHPQSRAAPRCAFQPIPPSVGIATLPREIRREGEDERTDAAHLQ